jgi:hypothetical protein
VRKEAYTDDDKGFLTMKKKRARASLAVSQLGTRPTPGKRGIAWIVQKQKVDECDTKFVWAYLAYVRQP